MSIHNAAKDLRTACVAVSAEHPDVYTVVVVTDGSLLQLLSHLDRGAALLVLQAAVRTLSDPANDVDPIGGAELN